MERRSAKRSTPRKRYTVDAFDGIADLQTAQSDDDSAMLPVEDDGSAEEFDGAAAEESPDEDAMSGVEGNAQDDASDDASDASERLLDETLSIAGDAEETPGVGSNSALTNFPFARSRRGRTRVALDDEPTFTRGVPEGIFNPSHGSKYMRHLFYFGPPARDFPPVHRAKVHWAFEPTLPNRKTDKSGFGGMSRSFFEDDDSCAKLVSEGEKLWREYGGRVAVFRKQVMSEVKEDLRTQYMPQATTCSRPFLMGPFKSQTLFNLPVGGSMPLIDAWRPDSQAAVSALPSAPSNYKCGFILNLGARIHCLEWAPNQHGSGQYLAVSVLSRKESDDKPFEEPDAPAFTPRSPRKSSIQILKFGASAEGFMDTTSMPELKVVLCSDWSDAKDLKWCAVACETLEQPGTHHVGLLAGIWYDGAIRVLDITVAAGDSDTRYIDVKHVAFESRPPDSVFTCLAWIGPTRIAAGCANGCVAVYDLPKAMNSDSPNPRPTIYTTIASSFILSITSCFPSRPNLILTTSMAGYITMTDLTRCGQTLSSPSNTVFSLRTRICQPLLAWHDFAQVALQVDENFVLRGTPIRRMFATVSLGRYRSNATSLAVSPCHPFVLAGAASGEVVSINPLNRAIDGKRPIWQQTWFAHEWRRPTAQEVASSSVDESSEGMTSDGEGRNFKAGHDGLSRISEGYKAERVVPTKDEHTSPNQQDGTAFITIYEERSAITALAWNPNPHVGGWAAAGMGDGLLRIEDIAT